MVEWFHYIILLYNNTINKNIITIQKYTFSIKKKKIRECDKMSQIETSLCVLLSGGC